MSSVAIVAIVAMFFAVVLVRSEGRATPDGEEVILYIDPPPLGVVTVAHWVDLSPPPIPDRNPLR